MTHGINKEIRDYCRKRRIRIEDEGYDVTFIAPKGKTFSTEARSRHIADYDEMESHEILWHINID